MDKRKTVHIYFHNTKFSTVFRKKETVLLYFLSMIGNYGSQYLNTMWNVTAKKKTFDWNVYNIFVFFMFDHVL